MTRKDTIKIGSSFHQWLVVRNCGENTRKQLLYYCRCVCGKTSSVRGYDLVAGKSRSCGCVERRRRARSANFFHVRHKTLYQVWAGMKSRCTNNKHLAYKNYGGRGITVCLKWKDSFEDFYNDMKAGYKKGLTIDRIDNDGNYCHENCRWTTREINSHNTRNIKHITINGKTKPLYEWLSVYNRPRAVYGNRVYRYGWSPSDAITTDGTHCKI